MASLESTVNSKKISCILFLAVILVGLVITGSVFTGEKFHIDQNVLQKTQEKYGKEAVMRLVSWEELLLKKSGERIAYRKKKGYENVNTHNQLILLVPVAGICPRSLVFYHSNLCP